MGIDPQDRVAAQRLHLSAAQLDYVAGTGLSDYQYDDDEAVINAVDNVVNTLPERIQYLIEDLSALHRSQFLDRNSQSAAASRSGASSDVPDKDLL
jgi:hypothetical protein